MYHTFNSGVLWLGFIILVLNSLDFQIWNSSLFFLAVRCLLASLIVRREILVPTSCLWEPTPIWPGVVVSPALFSLQQERLEAQPGDRSCLLNAKRGPCSHWLKFGPGQMTPKSPISCDTSWMGIMWGRAAMSQPWCGWCFVHIVCCEESLAVYKRLHIWW